MTDVLFFIFATWSQGYMRLCVNTSSAYPTRRSAQIPPWLQMWRPEMFANFCNQNQQVRCRLCLDYFWFHIHALGSEHETFFLHSRILYFQVNLEFLQLSQPSLLGEFPLFCKKLQPAWLRSSWDHIRITTISWLLNTSSVRPNLKVYYRFTHMAILSL